MIEQTILMLCLNLQTPDLYKYNVACKNTLTAASIQTHFKNDIETIQHDAEKIIVKRTGDKLWVIAGFTYSTYVKNQITISTSFRPIADNLNVEFTSVSRSLMLTWSW